ncbi:hypothetical protein AA313_de0209018 [Arthrobotrys entomopaga]|nr:hypothetical protein AA313_de0209018 [Arthrobotrys entomopaga]
MTDQLETDNEFMKIALEEAQIGYDEGGIPIGSVLVSLDGKILGRGHNMRIQNSSPTLHAEMSALESASRLPAAAYATSTIYTTLSPCDMCTGAILLYKIPRVVMGENRTFVGGEDLLRSRGVEVVNLDDEGCFELLQRFVKARPADWGEDIGEEEKV